MSNASPLLAVLAVALTFAGWLLYAKLARSRVGEVGAALAQFWIEIFTPDLASSRLERSGFWLLRTSVRVARWLLRSWGACALCGGFWIALGVRHATGASLAGLGALTTADLAALGLAGLDALAVAGLAAVLVALVSLPDVIESLHDLSRCRLLCLHGNRCVLLFEHDGACRYDGDCGCVLPIA